jgi:hypothetical protein
MKIHTFFSGTFAGERSLNIMEKTYFRINKKEYCHINDEYIFIVNKQSPDRVPLAHELGEGWGVINILNIIFFVLLFTYTGMAISYYGISFFREIWNYAALFLLIVFLVRIKESYLSSRTPTISRRKILNVVLKKPRFSFPHINIYFEGPEGKTLRRRIPILYLKEAEPVLRHTGLLK